MAWDFSTEPEFQAQLDWMRAFVDEEIEPLSLFYDDMTDGQLAEAHRAAERRGEGPRLVGVSPRPRARWSGLRPGEARVDARDPRSLSSPAPNIFGNQAPDSGNSELIAIGGTPEQKEQWLEPLLRGEITSSFSLTEPHFSGSDPTMITTVAERDGDEYVINGHKWFASNACRPTSSS